MRDEVRRALRQRGLPLRCPSCGSSRVGLDDLNRYVCGRCGFTNTSRVG